MTPRPARIALTATALLAAILSVSASGQQPFQWPERPKNLQVLPKDWTGEQLRPVMRGFSMSLGVRCSHCHVGPEGASLAEMDFASDGNPKKDIARTMYRMLDVINDTLGTIPGEREKANMWCGTCHQGRPVPLSVPQELNRAYQAAGVDSAVARYEALRAEICGAHGYEIGEFTIVEMGYELLPKDADAALRLFELSAATFPESFRPWVGLGQAYEAAGDTLRAIESYERALAIAPDNQRVRQALEKLGSRR